MICTMYDSVRGFDDTEMIRSRNEMIKSRALVKLIPKGLSLMEAKNVQLHYKR